MGDDLSEQPSEKPPRSRTIPVLALVSTVFFGIVAALSGWIGNGIKATQLAFLQETAASPVVHVEFVDPVALEPGEVGSVQVAVRNEGKLAQPGLSLQVEGLSCIEEMPKILEANQPLKSGVATFFVCQVTGDRDYEIIQAHVMQDGLSVAEESTNIEVDDHRVEISISGDELVYVGDEMVVRVMVSNVGHGAIEDVMVQADGFSCTELVDQGEVTSGSLRPGKRSSFRCILGATDSGNYVVDFSAGEGTTGAASHRFEVAPKVCTLSSANLTQNADSSDALLFESGLSERVKETLDVIEVDLCPEFAEIVNSRLSTIDGDAGCPVVQVLLGATSEVGFVLHPTYLPAPECSFRVLDLKEVGAGGLPRVDIVMSFLALLLDGEDAVAMHILEDGWSDCTTSRWSWSVEPQFEHEHSSRIWKLSRAGCSST